MSKSGRVLFVTVYLLVGLGVAMTYSASAVYAQHVYDNPHHFLFRQMAYAFVGTIALFSAASVPVQFWKKHARAILAIAILFLGMVFLPVLGRTAGGAQRWIHLGPINFQPAEFAKIAVCIYLSDYLARKKTKIQKGGIFIFLPPLVLIGIVTVLILLQPDLGSTVFIFLTVSVLFFWAGLRMRYVAAAALVFVPVFYVLVMRVPYRLSRVTSYLNPWNDPQGSGFQIIQSFLAFGLGGLNGAGLGQGMQKLFYLPSGYNDFIFSIIGEEMGLIGALVVVLLYLIIFICGSIMAERAKQDYEKMMIMSITLLITLQAVIHMFVTTGLIPTKGLPLPFVSFGGTSMVFSLMAVGLLLGMDRKLKGRR